MLLRPRLSMRVPRPAARFLGGAALFLAAYTPGWAQTPQTLQGAPVQMQPYVPEPGVPNVTVTLGTPTPPPTIGGGTGTGGDGSGGGISGSSDALNTMLGTSWGAQAAADAQALGVNASALAATCVLESGCGANLGNGSGAQGVFQMYPAAFQEGLNTALAANPSLASQIVQGAAGMNDPVTESIAASGYLMQANQTLQGDGIANPTVMDARAYYQFGPTLGPQVAQASPSMAMSSLLPASWLASNGISSSETVAQWHASVQNKIGSASVQTVVS